MFIWKPRNELVNYEHVVNNIDFNDLEMFRFIEDKHLAKQISRMQNFWEARLSTRIDVKML